MTPTTSFDQLKTEQLDKDVLHHNIRNQQIIHKIAQLKPHRFAKRAESFSPDQASLLDDLIDTDIAAIENEPEILAPKSASSPAHQKPKFTGASNFDARIRAQRSPGFCQRANRGTSSYPLREL